MFKLHLFYITVKCMEGSELFPNIHDSFVLFCFLKSVSEKGSKNAGASVALTPPW